MSKKFKIEIWQYHRIADTYENDKIEEVLHWYRRNWHLCYDMGGCCFEVFDGEKRLNFEELCELGFHD